MLACTACACAPTSERVAPRTDRTPRWSEAWLAEQARTFLSDTAARRAALAHSLTNPGNLYSRQRLASYGLGAHGWDRLPAWDPRSLPVTAERAALLERGELPSVPASQPPLWDGMAPTTQAGWVALGRRVFFEYPMRAEVYMEWGLQRPALAAEVGVERTAAGELPGLVVFANVDGETRVGITCALCHTTVEDGALVIGAARRRFDYGRLRLAYFADTEANAGATVAPELARRMATWGPGRADVTEDDDEDPVAIPDLFGIAEQPWLTQAGTIRHDSPLALAIRQETQLTDGNHGLVRPPRELAWALAMYVYSLSPPAPVASPAATPERALGARLFAEHCGGCHANSAYGGETIAVGVIGTNPALATGRGRGTGRYRVPPLLRVGAGAPYLHDGSVSTLDELLSPARLAPGYTRGRLGPGPILGHVAGTTLTTGERAALIAFLATL